MVTRPNQSPGMPLGLRSGRRLSLPAGRQGLILSGANPDFRIGVGAVERINSLFLLLLLDQIGLGRDGTVQNQVAGDAPSPFPLDENLNPFDLWEIEGEGIDN